MHFPQGCITFFLHEDKVDLNPIAPRFAFFFSRKDAKELVPIRGGLTVRRGGLFAALRDLFFLFLTQIKQI